MGTFISNNGNTFFYDYDIHGRLIKETLGQEETTYEYDKAIDYYKRSAEIKEDINDDSGLKDVMNNLGDVYYKQKVLTSSILSYERTVDLIRTLDMEQSLGPVYNKLGVAHYEMGNYDEAEKFFKESMQSLFDSDNRKEASMSVNNIGNLLYISNKYNEAINYYERSLALKEETGYDYGAAVTLFNLGNAYRRSGNQEEALKHYNASLKIADSLGINSLSARNLKALVSSYEASRDFDASAEAKEKLNILGMTNVSIEVPLSENEMDLEIDKTQEILALLNEEAIKRKQIVEAEAEQKLTDMYISNLNKEYKMAKNRSARYLYLSAALGLIAAATGITSLRRKKRKAV